MNKYLVVGIVVVLIAAGGWYVMSTSPQDEATTLSPEIQETPESTESSSLPSEAAADKDMQTYTSNQYGFSFEYPATSVVNSVQTREVQIMWDKEVIPLPVGSLEVAGHIIVSPVPYSEFSEEKPIYDYDSCCSGTRYWFDLEKKQWQANLIKGGQVDNKGNPIPDPETPLSLSSNGTCTLEQKFGSNVFYKIESGDEHVPTDVYYFLPTNKGYAIRFMTSHDVRGDYSTYGESVRPDQKTLETIEQILSSVTLVGDTSKIDASCL
jgi:hypothetical protein